MAYNFFVHSDLVFGKDAAAALSGILENENIKNVMVIYDGGVKAAGIAEKVLAEVNKVDGIKVTTFDEVEPNPSNQLVERIYAIAKEAGVEAAETRAITAGEKYHTLLSKRFDRTTDGHRRHFASAMTLLGLTDGCNAQTGNGYLDIVDFILQHCCNVEANLRQLYRRVAFSIAIGNSDDHFRNHGFLLTPKGWTLSPAYDLNPTFNDHQSLLINATTNRSDLQLLLASSEEYMIGKEEATHIIEEVKDGVSQWRSMATRIGIAKREMDLFAQVFE